MPYAFAQVLGGFCGAALVYGNYKSAIDNAEGGDFRTHLTATIFATYPQTFMTTVGQFFSEVVATAILVICLFAIGDERNNPAGDFGPLIIFFREYASIINTIFLIIDSHIWPRRGLWLGDWLRSQFGS